MVTQTVELHTIFLQPDSCHISTFLQEVLSMTTPAAAETGAFLGRVGETLGE